MNFKIIRDQVAILQAIAESEILSTQEGPGTGQTLIAVRDGEDILIVTDPLRGGGMIVFSCSKNREATGSVHDDFRFLARHRPRK